MRDLQVQHKDAFDTRNVGRRMGYELVGSLAAILRSSSFDRKAMETLVRNILITL